MGDRYLTDLADVCRRAGGDVVEYDDWQRRSRGSGGYDSGRPTHVMVHHTASPPSWSGQRDADYCTVQDEDAPLSNLYLDRDGVVWVLAAGATNTNGKGSDWWGGGVPADSMNTYAIGIEANGGYGEAWPNAQCDMYVALVGVLCAAYAIDTHCVRGHFEWAPTRKVDPSGPSLWSSSSASWNMDNFRITCDNYALSGGTEDDMPLSNEDIKRIAKAVWDEAIQGDQPDESKPARWRLRQIHGMCRHYLGGWKESQPPPEMSLLKQIDENTR